MKLFSVILSVLLSSIYGALLGGGGALLLTIPLVWALATFGGGTSGEHQFAWAWILPFATVPLGAVVTGFIFAYIALVKGLNGNEDGIFVEPDAPELEVNCSGCKFVIRADASLAGLGGTCPECGSLFEFPD